MFNPSSPVTGSAQTGFTSPTYTLSADTPPDVNAKQYAVTGLGGTQAGVLIHSVGSPFTITMFRPKQYKLLAAVNPVTGRLRNVPKNTYKVIVRKGMIPLAGQPAETAVFTLSCDIPAGSDLAAPEQIKAALSAMFGTLSGTSAGVGDTVISGLL